jgi:hypothetical protein
VPEAALELVRDLDVEAVKAMLIREKELRLSPATQAQYRDPALNHLRLTEEIQERVGHLYGGVAPGGWLIPTSQRRGSPPRLSAARLQVVQEFGLGLEAVHVLRAAARLFPQDPEVATIPHYVKFNRSRLGDCHVPGTPAPDVELLTLCGQRVRLSGFMRPGVPLVLVSGSVT